MEDFINKSGIILYMIAFIFRSDFIEYCYFWNGLLSGARARFGYILGLVKTRVGYSCGKEGQPKSKNTLDFTEALQIQFRGAESRTTIDLIELIRKAPFRSFILFKSFFRRLKLI
jgi:hypothetical protein